MLITKAKESITLGSGKVVTEKICLSITNISFSLGTNKLIVYIKMSYELESPNPMNLEETRIEQITVSHEGKSMTQDELKAMLEIDSIVFNESGSNLLIDEMVLNSTQLLQTTIGLEPENYFGLTLDKWEEAK